MKSIPGLADYFRQLSTQVLLDALDDGQLLDRFIARREGDAFQAILKRHSAMVLGVCRRILGDCHDAEDAFQATFLVLANKAQSIQPRDRVGAWLHGVARRSALKLRSRRNRQQRGTFRIAVGVAEPNDERLELLDKELSRLPAIYRNALIVCELGFSARLVVG